MKNKLIFSILSILGIASILGLFFMSNKPTSKGMPSTMALQSSRTSSTVKVDTSQLSDTHSKTELETGFEMGGLKYKLEGSSLEYCSVDQPDQVTTLFLYHAFYDEEGTEYRLSPKTTDFLTTYTNLENVVCVQNRYFSTSNLLTSIDHEFDYYSFGRESFGYLYPARIKSYYICSPYETDYSNPYTTNISNNLRKSPVRNIYFMDYTQDWTEPYIKNTTELKNALDESIELGIQTTADSIFSNEYITSILNQIPKLQTTDFKATPYYNSASYAIDKEFIKYKISNINPKLKSLYIKKNYILSEETPQLNEIIWQGKITDEQLQLIHADNLIYTLNDSIADFNLWSKFKTTRLYPIDGIVRFASISTGNNLNDLDFMVYEPTPLKEEFSFVRSDSSLQNHVETYDMEAYHLKLKQFESTNGNIYYTDDETLSIDTLETYITEMTEGNFAFTTTEALDTQYQTFLETKDEIEPPTDEEGFVDDSEFIQGYQVLGSIYYTSSKSLEDILKIASNYILQKDGIRSDEEKEVSFLVDGTNLSTTIKVNGKIVASVGSHLQKLDSKDYGEFIYLQNVGAFTGVLLYDTTSKTTKTPSQLYDYLLNEVTFTEELPAPDFKDFSLTSPSSVDISSSLIHTNGKKYRVNMECLSFDLTQVKDLSNHEITFQQVMSPDDEQEDPESQYAVKTITKIYLPNTLNARGVPTSINNSIITYQGNPYIDQACIHTITSSNKNDGKDYTITIGGSLPDSIWYEHRVPVTILVDTYNVAFALCEDNTIIVILPHSMKITKDTLSSNLEAFLTKEVKLTEPNIKLVEDMNLSLTKTFTGSTYKNGKIDIVVSGSSSLLNSTQNKPVDQSKEKEGFTALTHLIFSDDVSVERAVKLVSDKLLYFNGYPVETPYKTNITLYPNSIGFEFVKEEKVVLRVTSTYKVIKNAPYSFVSAQSSYHTGIILTSPKDVMVTTFMNEVMPYIESTLEVEYSSTVSLATKGNTKLEGIYKLTDSNYYEYTYTIMALDIEAKENQVDVEIIYKDKEPSEDKKDTLDDIINDFKENFENNKAFKTMSIILGTILGLVLIYVIYLIIHKLYKWLKK